MKMFRYTFLLFFVFLSASTAAVESSEPAKEDLLVRGEWFPVRSAKGAVIRRADEPCHFFYSEAIPDGVKGVSYGACLDLRYFAGFPYHFMKKSLPGKTISMDVFIPESSVSGNAVVPNMIGIELKSAKDGSWREYYGSRQWTKVNQSGKYHLKIKVPEGGGMADPEVFSPEDIALVSVNFFIPESANGKNVVSFSIEDLRLGDIDTVPGAMRWQFMGNGRVAHDRFLPFFPGGSTFIYCAGKELDLDMENAVMCVDPGNDDGDKFLSFSVFVPEDLRQSKGVMVCAVKAPGAPERKIKKNIDSCDITGRVYFSVPLEAAGNAKKAALRQERILVGLKIISKEPHTGNMMPIVIEPIRIKKGIIIPFDKKWKRREIDEPAAEDLLSLEGRQDSADQMVLTARLKGGAVRGNQLYRKEIIRDLDNAPMDLENKHLEVRISPETDTSKLWQTPYRARIGIADTSGKLMFGPNISLSEGSPDVATLDVSMANPIPKGFSMPGFDPKKIKSLIINVEAPNIFTPPADIRISMTALSIEPRENKVPVSPEKIDFPKDRRDAASWNITKLIKDNGGYIAGINYPFPVVDVPKDVLTVPQIYPCVGEKSTDPYPLGLASGVTRKKMTEDLEELALADIKLVRLFILGHLEGVFSWGETKSDIPSFPGSGELTKKLAGMKVEELAVYLNNDPDKIFRYDVFGTLNGLNMYTMKDFSAMLDILEDVEKKTGKRINVIISLYDFTFADGVREEGPKRMYPVGEYPQIVRDPEVKVKVEALVWKMLRTLSLDPRFYRYVSVVEVINEPENAVAINNSEDFQSLVNFVGENLYLAKDAVGPMVPVSVGFRSWTPDLAFWKGIADGIDILMVHYWNRLESYDNDTPDMWPMDRPVEELWDALGTKSDGRQVGMAEISALGDGLERDLERLEKAGYDFTLIWSYSGHDGYEGKKRLREIGEFGKKQKNAAVVPSQ